MSEHFVSKRGDNSDMAMFKVRYLEVFCFFLCPKFSYTPCHCGKETTAMQAGGVSEWLVCHSFDLKVSGLPPRAVIIL